MNKSDRQVIFDKYGGHCAYCGCELTGRWHVDHKEPIRRHDTGCMFPELDCIDNMVPSCSSCNINKHSMDIEDFRKQIAGFMKHLNEINTQYKIAKRYNLILETNRPVVFYFEQLNG